jgi:hypothetical protein
VTTFEIVCFIYDIFFIFQAIMQKQAESTGKSVKIKDEPNSPKYLLGVPTSEPLFFKAGGQRQPGPTTGTQSVQSSPSPSKPAGMCRSLKLQASG